MNWEINAELWQGTEFLWHVGKSKYRVEHAKLKSHHAVKEGKEKNVIKLHRFVLLAGSLIRILYVFIVRALLKKFFVQGWI